jgi:rubrerythrin
MNNDQLQEYMCIECGEHWHTDSNPESCPSCGAEFEGDLPDEEEPETN